MMNSSLTLLVVATLAGCGTNESEDTKSTTSPKSASTSELQCYALMAAGDTVRLNLNQQGSEVTGTLVYQLARKDSNIGTLNGQMRGDTLLATYTFQSEGQESKRAVAFLAKDGGFVEGYGNVQQQNDAMVFTPGTILTFGTDRLLTKIDCSNQ